MEPLRYSESLITAGLPSPLPNRVHYACGRNVLSGWLNVDGIDVSFPYGACPPEIADNIFRCDLAAPHPFPADVFDWGYSEDFLEHLDQASAVVFLCEVYRCLKPGGVFRLSCPGFATVLAKHLPPAPRWPNDLDEFRREAYTRWHHLHFWTAKSLAVAAFAIGFAGLEERAYGESRYPELCGLETRPEQAALNLHVELRKGT